MFNEEELKIVKEKGTNTHPYNQYFFHPFKYYNNYTKLHPSNNSCNMLPLKFIYLSKSRHYFTSSFYICLNDNIASLIL